MLLLSCRSYGVTLWFPTYVDQITTQKDIRVFEAHCNRTVTGSDQELESFCGCDSTVFADMEIKDIQLSNFRMDGILFRNVTFKNVSFSTVIFNGTQFSNGSVFRESNFSTSYFNGTSFDDISFDSVQIESSLLCSVDGSGTRIVNSTRLNTAWYEQPLNQSNLTCDYPEINCIPPNSKIYRDSFFITASAFPGNIASAIAVYFLRRNYWLGKVLAKYYT